jgi:hypothetical protein
MDFGLCQFPVLQKQMTLCQGLDLLREFFGGLETPVVDPFEKVMRT